MLVSVLVVLDAEFHAESNEIIFRVGYRSKYDILAQNTVFFENFGQVISVRIRNVTCAGFVDGCAERSVKFCIE